MQKVFLVVFSDFSKSFALYINVSSNVSKSIHLFKVVDVLVWLKVSKFQNEFMKSSFSKNINKKLSGFLPNTLQGRNTDNFMFIFWETLGDFINSF